MAKNKVEKRTGYKITFDEGAYKDFRKYFELQWKDESGSVQIKKSNPIDDWADRWIKNELEGKQQ